MGVVVACLAGSGLVAAGTGEKAPDRAASAVLAAARRELGDRYRWGGSGPDAWDCSGLTSTLWRTVGNVRGIPRTSREQQAWAWPVSRDRLLPGDLVFFGDPVSHVSIYIGRGRVIDASSSKGRVLERAIWTSDVVRYGRVPRPGLARPPAPKPPAAVAPKSAAPAPRRPANRPPAVPPTVSADPVGPNGMRPVPTPAHRARTSPSPWARRLLAEVGARSGSPWRAGAAGPAYDAVGLIRAAAARVDRMRLPSSPAALERLTRRVRLADLRPGDLVFYGAPAVHVGVYVGGGQMIDASRVLRKVVRRPVFASETVRFGRLR